MKNVIWISLAATCLILAFFAKKQNLNSEPAKVNTKPSQSSSKRTHEEGERQMSAAKKKFISEYERALENGTLTYWEGPEAVFLDLKQIALIKRALSEKPSVIKQAVDNAPLKSSKEAFDFLTNSISMAAFGIPEIYSEDEDFYYFSGGTGVEPVNDFSSGFAVNKKTRSLIRWKLLQEES